MAGGGGPNPWVATYYEKLGVRRPTKHRPPCGNYCARHAPRASYEAAVEIRLERTAIYLRDINVTKLSAAQLMNDPAPRVNPITPS